MFDLENGLDNVIDINRLMDDLALKKWIPSIRKHPDLTIENFCYVWLGIYVGHIGNCAKVSIICTMYFKLIYTNR